MTRCFVFEPSEDHIRQDSQHLKNLVMFPPGAKTPGLRQAHTTIQYLGQYMPSRSHVVMLSTPCTPASAHMSVHPPTHPFTCLRPGPTRYRWGGPRPAWLGPGPGEG